MDRYELRAALLAAGVSPDAFQLADAHEHQPVPPDFWFLRPGDGGWEIGPYERGRYKLWRRYATEAEASAALFHILAEHSTS
ncbi:hypothetical protein CO540_18785 [Micromonospora sp. WMMA2032]|uniref:hypothetical protein n=1 Tax=Micromonospora TaxID=1873 RepID=UPI000C05CD8F|nr:hypothetical protein [Micromonospora sp. WMMA2032]ATO15627.1 hypothetical protein CO540_18785 [Micromonospora sp. WMMA2032]